jgi:hypothetical protein
MRFRPSRESRNPDKEVAMNAINARGRLWLPKFLALLFAIAVMWACTASAAWFDDMRLTFDPAASITPPNNSWAVAGDDAGNVHVVWFDSRDGNPEIYYKMFDGSTWSADERITFDGSTSDYPSVAAYGDRVVHVVWHDSRDGNFEIYHKKYDGSTWSADERLTTANNTSWNPSVAVGPDSSVHVVWHDTRDGFTEVYYKKHDGTSWGPDTRLTVAAASSSNPCVAADGSGNVHVVWNDARTGNFKIYYKKHDGTSWGADTRLTDETQTSQKPCIAADPYGGLHVVWEDYRDFNFEIYYKEFDGAVWGADERLTVDTGVSGEPSITAGHEGRLHMVWHDKRTRNFQIYFKQRDGGVWGSDIQLTFEAGYSKSPSIAIAADSILHAVWYDGRDNNAEIYWTRTYRSDLPYPEIISVEPDSGYWGSTVHVDPLAGSNFLYQASVWLQRSGEPDVEAENIVVVNADTITCDLNLWGAAPGQWDVVVENPDGKAGTLVSGFKVIGLPDLALYSIEPDSGLWGHVVHIDSITGDGFHDSTRVRLTKEGEPDLIPFNLEILPPTKITCDLDLLYGTEGHWDLIAENPDGKADTLHDAFYVIGLQKPVLYSITPDEGNAGESVHISDLAGANFAGIVEVWLAREPEPIIPAVNIDVESPNKITCDLPLPLGSGGLWDVVVRNPDGQKDTLTDAFAVVPGAWGPDIQLTSTGSGALTSRPNGRCLAVDGSDNVHIVWYDYRHGSAEIYYRMHDGAAWGPEERLTESDRVAEYPCVAVDVHGQVHVAWTDFRDGNWEIYYKMHDGLGWSEDLRLTHASDDSRMPAIACDNAGDVHMVWYDARSGIWDVFYKKYDGAWSPDTMISNSGTGHYSALPAVAVDDSFNVHVAWYDSRHGPDEIYYRKFNGAVWEPEVRISATYGDSWSPSVVTTGNRVFVAWHDSRYGDYEILSRVFEGSTWGPEERVTYADGVSGNACLAADDSGRVHLVWHDDRDGNLEVYYSEYSGTAWTGDLRLTTASGDSKRPFAGCSSGGKVHVMWYDDRDGAYEIYYKLKDAELAGVSTEDATASLPHPVSVQPNPVSDGGMIAFSLPETAQVRLQVYDIAGRVVWEQDLGEMPGGTHRVAWGGLDREGRPVCAGVYFIRVVSGAATSTAKVVVLR